MNKRIMQANVQDFRKTLGLSSAAFSRLLGVSYHSVARWERTGQAPGPIVLLMETVNEVPFSVGRVFLDHLKQKGKRHD